jgi:hypothetical protein
MRAGTLVPLPFAPTEGDSMKLNDVRFEPRSIFLLLADIAQSLRVIAGRDPDEAGNETTYSISTRNES